MEDADAGKIRGRPSSVERTDPTMRYIARHRLWNVVAMQCGITPAAVRYWRRVPSDRVRDVETAIGRRRSLIRPDLYGRKVKQPQPQTA